MSIDEFFGLFTAAAPHGFQPFDGESTAWDIARSLPSVAAIPYDLRVKIERASTEQTFLRTTGLHVVDDVRLTSTQDHANLILPASTISIDDGDVTASENRLLRAYDEVLRALPTQ